MKILPSIAAALAALAIAMPGLSQSLQVTMLVGTTTTNVSSGGSATITAADIGQPVTASVTVRNTGTVNTSLTGVSVAGTGELTLVLAPGFPVTLSPNATTSFGVEYLPSTGNMVAAQVSIGFAANNVPAAFAFSVTGTSPRLAYSYYLPPSGASTDLNSGDRINFPAVNTGSSATCAFSVPVSPVMLAARMAASRLLWMIAERAGIGVVDADLLGRELVLDQLVFDALVGERAGRIEAERLEIARQHLHRRDAALLDRLDELGAGGEREIVAAPQAEPLGIGEIVHGGGAGRRDVDDAGIRQGVLEPQARAALLRGGLVAALALAADRVLHGVALVENDHSVEVGAQPFDDLPDARKLLAALVGAQRSVGRKKDAFRRAGSACPAGSERAA